ncbi:MAG: hypothetical protein LBL58_10170, partial [Tannerellaceae bacterium]|nr:hypothetical protein [Tannerellaceae bacterium]
LYGIHSSNPHHYQNSRGNTRKNLSRAYMQDGNTFEGRHMEKNLQVHSHNTHHYPQTHQSLVLSGSLQVSV